MYNSAIVLQKSIFIKQQKIRENQNLKTYFINIFLIGHDDFEEDMDGANEKDKKMRLSSMGGGKDPNG